MWDGDLPCVLLIPKLLVQLEAGNQADVVVATLNRLSLHAQDKLIYNSTLNQPHEHKIQITYVYMQWLSINMFLVCFTITCQSSWISHIYTHSSSIFIHLNQVALQVYIIMFSCKDHNQSYAFPKYCCFTTFRNNLRKQS